jgi:hypothetical protein
MYDEFCGQERIDKELLHKSYKQNLEKMIFHIPFEVGWGLEVINRQ